MAYTPEQITHVAESMYFDTLANFFAFSFEEEHFQILLNIKTLDRIQMGWVEAWKWMADEVYGKMHRPKEG